MRKAKAANHVVCPCCALAAPSREMMVWREKGLCRQLAVLDPRPGQGGDDEQWVSGPYRYYYVTHEHRVCAACHAHLEAGGQFADPLRNRGKMAFLVLMAILVVAIACLPADPDPGPAQRPVAAAGGELIQRPALASSSSVGGAMARASEMICRA